MTTRRDFLTGITAGAAALALGPVALAAEPERLLVPHRDWPNDFMDRVWHTLPDPYPQDWRVRTERGEHPLSPRIRVLDEEGTQIGLVLGLDMGRKLAYCHPLLLVHASEAELERVQDPEWVREVLSRWDSDPVAYANPAIQSFFDMQRAWQRGRRLICRPYATVETVTMFDQ